VHAAQGLDRPRLGFLSAQAQHAARSQGHVVQDRQVRKQVRKQVEPLEHHPNMAPHLVQGALGLALGLAPGLALAARDVRSVDADGARAGRFEPVQAAQQRALAAA